MSTGEYEEIVSIGERFKVERERLGYTQKRLAGRLATTEKTLITYETGATLPKLSKLILFHSLGADLLYVLVGERQPIDLENPSTPAQTLAAQIGRMDLNEADAELISSVVQRLASR